MMGGITMSSTSRTVLGAFASFICASALAEPLSPIVCPLRHVDKTGHSGKLTLASVFDGVPENRADLIPDLQTGEWNLASTQDDARQRGESYYLVCHYKGSAETVRFKLSYQIKLCKIDAVRGEIRASCQ